MIQEGEQIRELSVVALLPSSDLVRILSRFVDMNHRMID